MDPDQGVHVADRGNSTTSEGGFFNRRYDPWFVLACLTISFHNLLSLPFSVSSFSLSSSLNPNPFHALSVVPYIYRNYSLEPSQQCRFVQCAVASRTSNPPAPEDCTVFLSSRLCWTRLFFSLWYVFSKVFISVSCSRCVSCFHPNGGKDEQNVSVKCKNQAKYMWDTQFPYHTAHISSHPQRK